MRYGPVYVTCSTCRLVYFCPCTQFCLRDLAPVCACVSMCSCKGWRIVFNAILCKICIDASIDLKSKSVPALDKFDHILTSRKGIRNPNNVWLVVLTAM